MQLIKIYLIAFSFFNFSLSVNAQQQANKVIFCYGDFFPNAVKNYTYVVIETSHFSKKDIALLKENNTRVLGYISLGEVNASSAYYHDLKACTLGKNKLWNSYYISLANPETIAVMKQRVEKKFTEKGVDGLFLDNIDNYTTYGPTPHQKDALVNFLRKIKKEFPQSLLMQNAGLSILEDTHKFVDALAIESVASDYDFDQKKYRLREKNEFEKQLNILKALHKKYKLPTIFVEYAHQEKLAKKIKKRLQATGWPIFIGDIDLQTLPTLN